MPFDLEGRIEVGVFYPPPPRRAVCLPFAKGSHPHLYPVPCVQTPCVVPHFRPPALLCG